MKQMDLNWMRNELTQWLRRVADWTLSIERREKVRAALLMPLSSR